MDFNEFPMPEDLNEAEQNLWNAANSLEPDMCKELRNQVLKIRNERLAAEKYLKTLQQLMTLKTLSAPKPRVPRAKLHPPVKSWPDGRLLGWNPHDFCDHHEPKIKYEGCINALDALTSCRSLAKVPYDFHFEIEKYIHGNGIYVLRVDGPGYHTSNEDMCKLRGF